MDQPTLREIELLSGLMAAFLGVVVPGYALLVDPRALIGPTGDASTVIVLAGSLLALVAGVFLDSQTPDVLGVELGLPLLLVAVGTLWVFVVTGLRGVDWYVLPAALVGTVSVLASVAAHLQARQAT